jgi:hypothetical protein
MTVQEHKVMFLMFAKQEQHIKTLVNILTSRGILEGDDGLAFHAATRLDASSNALLLQEVREQYLAFATTAGLDVQAVKEATEFLPE